MSGIAPPVVPVVFDDHAILVALGTSPDAIRRQLRLYLQADLNEPSPAMIYQWLSRHRISERWRPRLLYAALRAGKLTMAQALKFDPDEQVHFRGAPNHPVRHPNLVPA